ncbi:MAG: hypothetical protein M1840_000087 [Geoglossum simile]|nr:MAG: hypothetical protein M1840_000087 [Geoglossum simile]
MVSLGEWNVESDDGDEEEVIGSVVEFAFGEGNKSYFVTSYPYRAENADRKDVRFMEQMNLPDYVLNTLVSIQPRYIMNLAIRGPDLWFLYYYSSSKRYGFDTKWLPNKPLAREEHIGVQLDQLRREARDQVSFCGFGPSPEVFYLRSTDGKKQWHPRLSRSVNDDLWAAFLDVSTLNNGCPRAVTFGKNNTWIVYGTESFKWSEHGLPRSLVDALNTGRREGWSINKVVLNRSNHREYVLVYDSGPVYYSFHPDFEGQFKKVIEQWSVRKRMCPGSSQHRHSFPIDNQYNNPDDSGSEATDDEVERRRREIRVGKQPRHRKNSSMPQPSISPTYSDISDISSQNQSDTLRQLRPDPAEPGRTPDPKRSLQYASASRTGMVTRHSSKVPVPFQSRLAEPKSESAQQQPSSYRKERPQSRQFLQTVKDLIGWGKGEK